MKHTPAPWEVVWNTTFNRWEVCGEISGVAQVYDEGDARLIVAVHALLEACEEARAALYGARELIGHDIANLPFAIDLLNAAIAQAKGEEGYVSDPFPIDMKRINDVRSQLDDPALRQEALFKLGEWVVWTCGLFGASPETSFRVAAEFVRGVSKTWEGK